MSSNISNTVYLPELQLYIIVLACLSEEQPACRKPVPVLLVLASTLRASRACTLDDLSSFIVVVETHKEVMWAGIIASQN